MANELLQKMMTGKAGPYVGFVIVLTLGILFAYLGVYHMLCLPLIIGIMLYILPKSMGAKTEHLLVFGVIFFVVLAVFSAFAVSKPFIEDGDKVHDSGDFTAISVQPYMDDGPYTFTVTVDVPAGGTIWMEYNTSGTVQLNAFGLNKGNTKVLTYTVSGNTYTFSLPALDDGKMYYYKFVVKDLAGAETHSKEFIGPVTMDDSQITTFCLSGNFYFVGANIMVFFFIVVLLTAFMRKNLEKTRARLESEGRLYPQGYGRCKECSTIILPGEVMCRKCGAYLDIPEEMKVEKVEYYECSDCGKEIPSTVVKCPFCGAMFDDEIIEEIVEEPVGTHTETTVAAPSTERTEEVRKKEEPKAGTKCKACGNLLKNDEKVCPGCGTKRK